LQQYDFSGKPVAILPNAGFPEVVNERTFYVQNPGYFAERVNNFKTLGFKVLGGCCGTTPSHIQSLAAKEAPVVKEPAVARVTPGNPPASPLPVPNRFAEKLRQGQFIIAAELDPPFDAATDKIMDRARVYQAAGVDIITIADSPLAKPRADSVTVAAKIMRELNMETLPHLCCRDRNSNALKSAVLAAHIEGIRNVLAVTGDPLPRSTQNEIKSVFNLNSLELISMLSAMNQSTLDMAPLTIGGALNLNVRNRQLELERMLKKVDKGATFFLTQPLFNREAIEFLPKIVKPDGVRIIAGILPVVTHANALFLQNEVPGMTLPDEFVNRFHPGMERDTAEQVGISLATEIAVAIRPYVDGFYFITPFNRAAMVVAILRQLGLISS
ncbi:MAG TPA: methylenetetrahydrofolate reductase, partial [Bacillota bacterium]|nr:methylenetetrahydrofolate reductase [Bacillota bacterium]